MSSNLDLSKYRSIDSVNKAEGKETKDKFDLNKYKVLPGTELKQKKSYAEKLAESGVESVKGIGRIAGRSAISAAGAPSKAIGSFFNFLSTIGDEDLAGNKLYKKASEWFSTVSEQGKEQLKSQLENLLGKSFGSGEEALAQFSEKAADLYSTLPLKGLEVPSVLSAAAGQTAKELGFGPEVQLGAEIIGSGGKELYQGLKSLKPVQKIVEESKLVLPRIVEKTKEGLNFIKPKALAGAKEKAYEKVSEQAKNLLTEMKFKAMPLSIQIEKGVDVEANLGKDLNKVQELASKFDHKIESNFISDYLSEMKNKILSVPVPSIEEEGILKLIEKFEDKYGAVEGGLKFYSPKEYVGQFRKINKDAKKLYETQLLQGKQLDTIGFYEGLKEEIVKTLESGTPKEFSSLVKETNKQYAELANLNKFETFVENITKDGVIDANKLANTFKSPSKSKALRRQIGKEGFNNLRLISNDLLKVKDKLKLIEEIGLKDIVKSGAVAGLLSKLGLGKIGFPIQAGKKIAEASYGYFLLNPKGVRDFDNFLKAVQSGSKNSMITYIKKMDESALNQEKE